MQDVGEVVAQRRLVVEIALGHAQLERLAQQLLGAAELAGGDVVAREVVERGDRGSPGSGSPRDELEAALEVARARSRAARGCCWPARGRGGRPGVLRRARAPRSRAPGRARLAAPPGDAAAVGLHDGRVGAERERLARSGSRRAPIRRGARARAPSLCSSRPASAPLAVGAGGRVGRERERRRRRAACRRSPIASCSAAGSGCPSAIAASKWRDRLGGRRERARAIAGGGVGERRLPRRRRPARGGARRSPGRAWRAPSASAMRRCSRRRRARPTRSSAIARSRSWPKS